MRKFHFVTGLLFFLDLLPTTKGSTRVGGGLNDLAYWKNYIPHIPPKNPPGWVREQIQKKLTLLQIASQAPSSSISQHDSAAHYASPASVSADIEVLYHPKDRAYEWIVNESEATHLGNGGGDHAAAEAWTGDSLSRPLPVTKHILLSQLLNDESVAPDFAPELVGASATTKRLETNQGSVDEAEHDTKGSANIPSTAYRDVHYIAGESRDAEPPVAAKLADALLHSVVMLPNASASD
ncbi:hypothetical protein TGVEG_210740 [Toxoplasma gondii VEG]|uniref:Uncharacterized protein n=2 Tax=Toxoplasma gondii TaxID=5811 RepID=V4Z6T2_TOXGV|nr:hypothetical protein TGVEG_210740 [Toxoplasma gondii VEG]KFG43110.1 hypothetical protein TGP89_210740 [Toxoplasma gondii p89]